MCWVWKIKKIQVFVLAFLVGVFYQKLQEKCIICLYYIFCKSVGFAFSCEKCFGNLTCFGLELI